MTTPKLQFDPQRNVAVLGGASHVFHCHFYNCALQQAIEDGLGEEAGAVQRLAAQEVVRRQLARVFVDGQPPPDRLDVAARLFGHLGFGLLELGALDRSGGVAVAPHSHYAMGWLATRGRSESPICHFVSGFVGGAVAAAFGLTPERIAVRELACFAAGSDRCEIAVEVR